MKILIVNTYDIGGAANACLRLHEGLLKNGIDSNVLLRDQHKKILNTHKLNAVKKKKSRTQRVWDKFSSILKTLNIVKDKPSKNAVFIKDRASTLELFSSPTSNYDITASDLYKEADIINLHWVADFLDYKSFFEKNTKLVIWTLHDMNPFTGGEHYEEQFLGIDNFGKPLPRQITVLEEKVFKKVLSFKIKLFKKVENLTIVAPSIWLVEEAKKSQTFNGKQVLHIPYGLNKDIFKPRDKNNSRDILKIPKDKKVILFVAESIDNNRKGFNYLKIAFEQLESEDVVLCAVGNKNEVLASINNVIELGMINDELLMSKVYSAADVFVIPSLMDNLPNTVLESLMCGTPVIGFPIGGIPDMIENGVNGLITKEISVSSLLETIKLFLTEDLIFDRNLIRKEAVKKYALEVQVNRYMELFNNVLRNVN